MDAVKETLRHYILKTHLAGESPDSLQSDTPLLTSGILDSLAALGLVTFIEEQFGVALDVYDTSIERFDRIDDIASTIAAKQGAHLQPARMKRSASPQ